MIVVATGRGRQGGGGHMYGLGVDFFAQHTHRKRPSLLCVSLVSSSLMGRKKYGVHCCGEVYDDTFISFLLLLCAVICKFGTHTKTSARHVLLLLCGMIVPNNRLFLAQET